MKPHTQASFATGPPHVTCFRRATVSRAAPSENHLPPPHPKFRQFSTAKRRRVLHRSNRITAALKTEHRDRSDGVGESSEERVAGARSNRRAVLAAPFLAAGASFLLSAAATRAEEKATTTPVEDATGLKPEEPKKKEEEEVITSRIYDATAIGEPLAIGKEKGKVWEKVMNARVVYLGEAEQVPVRDDKELELEIVRNLHRRCVEREKRLSLALEAFPSNLQEPLNQYMDKKYAFQFCHFILISLYVSSVSNGIIHIKFISHTLAIDLRNTAPLK